MSDDDTDDEDFGEYSVTFTECTCDHDSEQHGWMSCEVDGCECEGHWEE